MDILLSMPVFIKNKIFLFSQNQKLLQTIKNNQIIWMISSVKSEQG
jgi:hypothetical protein